MKSRNNLARLASLALACAALAGGAQAQPPSAAALFKPATPPDQSGAIQLLAHPGPDEEIWETFHGELQVRNVTVPTLTPFLPDPAKATGAAVIVAPGGGFLDLSMQNEGYPVARWLADHGIAAFLLKYRTRPTPRDPAAFLGAMSKLLGGAAKSEIKLETPPEAIADAQAALRLVQSRAQAWKIDPARIGLMGFSAGAMTTLSVTLADDKTARPAFIGAIYGPMGALAVPADAPPAFMAVALDDPLMARGKSLALIDAWRSTGRSIEVHLYASGNHGFGMSGRSPGAALWIDEFYAWMKTQGLLAPAGSKAP